MTDAASREDLIDQLAEEFLARFRRGERPAVQEYTAKYPEYAAQIRDLFPALVLLEQAAPLSDSESARPATAPAAVASAGLPEQLGDYRIMREIGRGGMGVVYEAEQQSLGRRVALKVLLRAATQDAKVLARFHRESRAAAQLHHTNIVPVYEVGQQDGSSYYAMQFIRGQALDEVFQELQHLRSGSSNSERGTRNVEPGGESGAEFRTPSSEFRDGAAALPDRSELSSVSSSYRGFCRNVARLGLQAAEALAYAHGRGIIHRDIKPANLLLDTTGVLWVSDFGLAKTQDPALTDTGDLVGTLRYMAPERFRGECDVRADIYALGLTLYELLVLRPAFDGKDRLHLVEQIGRQEPARLRTLDSRIPRDLETIIMKAIEKDPRRRYPSAEVLAGDLRRFLADEPIMARRIGPLERLGRWGRRNPVVASLSAAVVLVAGLGFAGVFGQMQVAQANERTAERKEQEAKDERDEAQRQRDEVQALNEKLRQTQAQLQRTLYAAHMNLAQQAWAAGGIERVRELLELHRPRKGETDLRGFEWYYLYRLSHAELLTIKGFTRRVASVAFSSDGKRLATGGGADDPFGGTPCEVKVWDAQTGQELLTVKGAGYRRERGPDGKLVRFPGQSSEVHYSGHEAGAHVAFSPDGKRLVSASHNQVKLWDAQSGKELLDIKEVNSLNVNAVAFSPDGKRLACGVGSGERARAMVWDAQTGAELLVIPLKNGRGIVTSVAFSPDGERLATALGALGSASSDKFEKTLKVWDARSGKPLLTLNADGERVAFSPDGKRLAGTCKDQTVKVWDARNGQELLTLKGHTGAVSSVAFSPDSKRLASASEDKTVKVWDAQTGKELFTHKGHNAAVWSVTFSPDGKRLASHSDDNTVRVWDAQKEDIVREPLPVKVWNAR